MKTIKVSIVVPAYNAQESIQKTLQSLLFQTLQELEVVVVNDGSTDKTKEIIENIAKTDSRVVLINKENEGPSIAREVGISKARGEFIYFLDSDDYLEKNALLDMYTLAKKRNADIVVSPFYEDNNEKLRFCQAIHSNKEEFSSIEFIHAILQERAYWALWNKLYAKELFDTIYIPKELNYGEDLLLVVQLVLNANKVALFNKAYLHYIYNPLGLSKAKVSTKMYQMFIVYDKLEQIFKEKDLYEEFKEDLNFARNKIVASFLIQKPYESDNNYSIGFQKTIEYLQSKPLIDKRLLKPLYFLLLIAQKLSFSKISLKKFIEINFLLKSIYKALR
jgi:glycosyltransferase involved in cell wall biosynthesis